MKRLIYTLLFVSLNAGPISGQAGHLDSTFSDNGTYRQKLTDINPDILDFVAINTVVQADGKLLTLGFGSYFQAGDVYDLGILARISDGGTPDQDFYSVFPFVGIGLSALPEVSVPTYSVPIFAAEQPDRRIVVAGNSLADGRLFLARLEPDGEFDAAFGNDFASTLSFYSVIDEQGNSAQVQLPGGMAIDADKKVVLSALIGGRPGLLRIAADGSTLDSTFAGRGWARLATASTAGHLASELVLHDDGRITFTGRIREANGGDRLLVARVLADGTPDPSFGLNGLVQLPQSLGNTEGWRILEDAQGRLMVAGIRKLGSQEDGLLARFMPDGSLDAAFADDGILLLSRPMRLVFPIGIGLDQQQRLTAGWRLTDPSDNTRRPLVLRYLPDGSLDGSYGNEGEAWLVDDTYTSVFVARMQPDGKVLVGCQEAGSVNYILFRLQGGDGVSATAGAGQPPGLVVFPNPSAGDFYLEAPVSGWVYNALGEPVARLHKASRIRLHTLPAGLYWLVTEEGQSVRLARQ